MRIRQAAAALGVLALLALTGCATPAGPLPASTKVSAISGNIGPVSGGTKVVLTGSGLDAVTGVSFGDEAASVISADATTLTLTVPASNFFAEGPVDITLRAGSAASAISERFTYKVETPVDRQMTYLFAHWNHRNVDAFGALGGTDCVNFASQGLLARGWTMDSKTDATGWWFWKGQVTGAKNYAKQWISSTAFMKYMLAHPARGVLLDQGHLADARVGDIVQFDYRDRGIRDHTATISRITDGHLYVVQHSNDADYQSVDHMIATHQAGAKFYVWHLTT